MPFTDNFNGAAVRTHLNAWTPSGGTAWTLDGGLSSNITVETDGTLRTVNAASNLLCDDQGSADQYIQARLKNLVAAANQYVHNRWVSGVLTFVGWRCAGVGAAGLRLTESVAGVVTDLVSFQGAAEVVYRVEVSGTTAKIFADGVQQGTDQTVASSTATRQGLRSGTTIVASWIDDFEAGALAGAGQTIALNQTSESDTAQPVGSAKHKAVDQAGETDLAQAVSSRKAGALGQVMETDAAQAIAAARRVALGQAGETDSAQAVAPRKVLALGQVTETDAAQAVTVPGSINVAVGQATETDGAQAIDTTKVVSAGQVLESDAAQAVSSRKVLAVGMVTEAEYAQAIAHYKTRGVLQPVESDSAHSISSVKVLALGQIAEINGAQAITAAGGATLQLSQIDLDAIAAAVWAADHAVNAHAKLDAILARLQC